MTEEGVPADEVGGDTEAERRSEASGDARPDFVGDLGGGAAASDRTGPTPPEIEAPADLAKRIAVELERLRAAEERVSLWRVVRQWVSVLVMIAVAISAAYVGLESFRSPPSQDLTWDNAPLVLALVVPPSSATSTFDSLSLALASPVRTRMSVSTTLDPQGNVSYEFWLPEADKGDSLVLFMTQGAIMTDASASIALPSKVPGWSRSESAYMQYLSGSCEDGSACAATIMKIPNNYSPSDKAQPSCSMSVANSSATAAAAEAATKASIIVTGTPVGLRKRIDRFHASYQIPVILPVVGTPKEYDSADSGTAYVYDQSASCVAARFAEGEEIDPASTTPATFTSSDTVVWMGNNQGSTPRRVVTKSSTAEYWANVSILFVGGAVAVAAGFIPIAYESTARWRRGRRARRGAKRAAPGEPAASGS